MMHISCCGLRFEINFCLNVIVVMVTCSVYIECDGFHESESCGA